MKRKIRPAAVPLITVDPFFSVWSCADRLYDDCTRHWTEIPAPLAIGLVIDGIYWSMGTTETNFAPYRMKMTQTDLTVRPLTTEYTFENEDAKVTVTFTTPLLLDRLDILCRPVSYVAYEIERKCGDEKEISFVFGINSRCCVRNKRQTVSFQKTEYSLCCGNTAQVPLAQSGDMDVIDWGYLHLCDRNAYVAEAVYEHGLQPLPTNEIYNPFVDMPYLTVTRSQPKGVITLAYDEIYPIEYFGKPLKEYFTRYFDSFDDIAKAAVSEYDEIKALCDKFDSELLEEAGKLGENYQIIVSMAYRQAIAAHKLVADENGETLFLSKECESNGCIGTLDVTYPTIPILLKYNPELVLGMLNPIMRYAKSDAWPYEFVPHDVGQYPLANGQVYNMSHDKDKEYEGQMPIEESGNMLLCLAAVAHYSGKTPDLFEQNKEMMKKWADYLVENGYDPANQLCTDDFAGHLGHNCNLSLKAILGIAAYGKLAGDEKYLQIAKEYAIKWEQEAKAIHGATRLCFDNPDGWSLKYNMVWDRLLGWNFFSDEVKNAEVNLYLSKLNRYGVPLDSRADYTKTDWLIWSTCICDNKEYFDKVTESLVNMIDETTDRVPLTDWYDTIDAKHIYFQNRPVVGALFINLL